MCGIAGIMYLDNQRPVSPKLVEAMIDPIAHRGPDDQGVFTERNIGLGHRRLSILDLSAAGHQPMSSPIGDGWIVYNGEIYNFQKLRQYLKSLNITFASNTDTEVLLAMLELEGTDALLQFEGMYAFAYWKPSTNTLMLARDPLGIKPLYYYMNEHLFAFASEIKSLLAIPEVPRELNPEGLQNFLAHGHSPAPQTLFKGIYKLLPGHWMQVHNGKMWQKKFWSPVVGPDEALQEREEEEYLETLSEMLADSVQDHLISDVPVGVFLSGGLDSSALVALMARSGQSRIKTFTIGFDFGQRYNEIDDARVVADYYATDHHELVLTSRDLQDSLFKLIQSFDEPFGDPAAFPTYFVSQLASQHVKVVLSGEGGDELFGGYKRYLAERYSEWYRHLPDFLRAKAIPALTNRVPRARRLKQLVRTIQIQDPVIRQANWQMVFSGDLRQELLKNGPFNTIPDDCVYESFRRYRRPDGKDGMNGVLYADSRSWLSDRYLEKADKTSMAHSLEVRVPFLTPQIAEFAYSLPIDSKVKLQPFSKKRQLKRLFAQALENLLPKSILEKPKHGFAVPLDPWFRQETGNLVAEILFDSRTRQRGYFNTELIERMFTDHRKGREVRNNQLWLLVLFELWHREYLDKVKQPVEMYEV
ncbi:MAG: asparagine synthase (glutamine-hydrolyzing) [Calditrichia bacterium]